MNLIKKTIQLILVFMLFLSIVPQVILADDLSYSFGYKIDLSKIEDQIDEEDQSRPLYICISVDRNDEDLKNVRFYFEDIPSKKMEGGIMTNDGYALPYNFFRGQRLIVSNNRVTSTDGWQNKINIKIYFMDESENLYYNDDYYSMTYLFEPDLSYVTTAAHNTTEFDLNEGPKYNGYVPYTPASTSSTDPTDINNLEVYFWVGNGDVEDNGVVGEWKRCDVSSHFEYIPGSGVITAKIPGQYIFLTSELDLVEISGGNHIEWWQSWADIGYPNMGDEEIVPVYGFNEGDQVNIKIPLNIAVYKIEYSSADPSHPSHWLDKRLDLSGDYSFTVDEDGEYAVIRELPDEVFQANLTSEDGFKPYNLCLWELDQSDNRYNNSSNYNNVVITYNLKANTPVYIGFEEGKATSVQQVATNSGGGLISGMIKTLEEILAWIVRTCANGIVAIVNWAVGQSVTIDDIIFNHYEPTRLFYFGVPAGETAPADDSLIVTMIDVINKWSAVFTEVAIAVYLAVLLYMGIQILMKSTAQKNADFKRFFVDWIIGLGLLFFMPVFVKYSIEINDAIVKSIEKSKIYKSNESIVQNGNLINYDINPSSSDEEKANFVHALEEVQFSDNNNYMAKMKSRAEEKPPSLAYAVVYIIMAWQLAMLVIVYYRRLFTIGFLLVLFPLVAMTYAIDKVRDGKSQAFDRWGKEIFLNIFIQTFHALIYVFAVNASGSSKNDWILMIIGISFLFKGEEIIKNLFGQKADSAPSLMQTAATTAAIYTAASTGVKKLKDNFIGKNSHLGKALEARKEARTYDMMADNFNDITDARETFRMPSPQSLPHAPEDMDDEEIELANAILVINNRNFVNDAQLSMAIRTVQNYKGPHNEMLKDLNVDPSKIKKMEDVKQRAINQLANGTSEQDIRQNIRIELETLFGEKDAQKMEQALFHEMKQESMKTNHKKRATSREEIEKELHDTITRSGKINASFKFASKDGDTSDLDSRIDTLITSLTNEDVTNEDARRYARSVEILRDRSSGKYSKKQIVESMEYVVEHKDDNDGNRAMAKVLVEDVDEMRLVLARKLSAQSHKSGTPESVKNWAEETVNYYENNDNPLSDDTDRINVLSIYKDETSVRGQYNEESIIDRIRQARLQQNARETETTRRFAEKFTVEEKRQAPTFRGMSQDMLRDLAEARRQEAREEGARAILETGGAVLGAPIGAAAGVAFADTDSGALVEAATGAFAGAVAGDQAVSAVMGGNRTKEFIMRNPYTGEEEKVSLRVGGALSEKIYSFDDPELPEDVRASIREQFIKTAAAKKLKEEEEREKVIKMHNKKNK